MGRIVVLLLIGVSVGVCQTPAKEPDAQQALLAEVHLLRQDLEAVTIASLRVQIALYSLQMQDGAVARATQKVDEAQNKCTVITVGRDRMAAEVRNTESAIAKGPVSPQEAKGLQEQLAMQKVDVESQTSALQRCQATEAEASSKLRGDQAKLAELQARIEQLDKTLENLGVDRK